jgi:hypothetical protein
MLESEYAGDSPQGEQREPDVEPLPQAPPKIMAFSI